MWPSRDECFSGDNGENEYIGQWVITERADNYVGEWGCGDTVGLILKGNRRVSDL